MTIPEPAPAPVSPRDRMEMRLNKILPGPRYERERWLILGDADEYAAHMIEKYARPDDRWGPQ